MLYLKESAGEGKYKITELTSENVYSVCPVCGEESAVIDFENIITQDDFNWGRSVCCSACTRVIHERGLAALMNERSKELAATLQGMKGGENDV